MCHVTNFICTRLGGFEYLLGLVPNNREAFIGQDTFAQVLDVWAQMHVENCDIRFKIVRKESSHDVVEREVEIMGRTECKGYYLTKEDVWTAAAGDRASDSGGSVSPNPLSQEPELNKKRGINH